MAKALNFTAEAERLQRENDKLKFLERLFEQAVKGNIKMVVLDQIKTHIESAAQLLDITVPKIVTGSYIVSDETGKVRLINQKAYDMVFKHSPDTGYMSGYYDDHSGVVYLATYDPESGRPSPEAEVLFSALHELRHVWQKRYEKEKYFSKNAVGFECISDISEVDADAFALAYMAHRTIYNPDSYMSTLSLYMALDHGKREARAKEIAETLFKRERKD